MSKNDSQLLVKLPKSLRDAFNDSCKNMDSTGAQELRKFMREYVAKNGQKSLL